MTKKPRTPEAGSLLIYIGPRRCGQRRAARRLAKSLGFDYRRVEPKEVLGRYIGETEKNLDRLLEGGGGKGAVLLFDEADALFGKRSEVEDSHDKFANLEVSYLLDRMECWLGWVVLCAEDEGALPRRLVRRSTQRVEFPPGLPVSDRE